MTPEERADKKLRGFFDSIHPQIRSSEETILTSIAKDLMIEATQEAQREAVEWTVRLVEHQYHRCSSLMNGHEVFQKALRELTPEKILGNAYERKTPL